MEGNPCRRHAATGGRFGAAALVSLAVAFAASARAEETEGIRSVAGLREALARRGRVISPLRLEGVVCAASARKGLVAIQDKTATALLELPPVAFASGVLRKGANVIIESPACSFTRGAIAIQAGTAPVVENDGYHSALVRSGEVFLGAGMQPLRLEWVNAAADFALAVEYAGPSGGKVPIPASALFHRAEKSGGYLPGLRYAAYEGDGWYALPDFSTFAPVAGGVAEGFDIGVRTRSERSGLVFTGFLNVAEAGRYEIHLTSDDGARMFLGAPEISCTTAADDSRAVRVETSDEPAARRQGAWRVAEGMVTYAALHGGMASLELTDNSGPVPVTIADPAGLDPAGLMHKRVRIAGVGVGAGMVALDASQIEIPAAQPGADGVLTRAVEIRRLKPDEAARPFRVELQGVVTMATIRTLVLQDASGGIFVHHLAPVSSEAPKVGEVWKISGTTSAGHFSPVVYASEARFVRAGDLPKPSAPTWEQLLSGSLDAEQVEIEGIVVRASEEEVKLLTRGGVATISDIPLYPLPMRAMTERERAALVGSLVRFRGVYASSWDASINRVHPAELRLGNAMLTVDEPAPADPFAAPLARAADLLRFTSDAGALERVKVGGIVLDAKPPEYFVADGEQGIRISSAAAQGIGPGDRVEAVGFPRFGGPSPVLLEATLRRTGSGPLPPAREVEAGKIPDSRLDSMRVRIEATVLGDSVRQNERALELRAGSNHFFAVMPAGGSLETLPRDSLLSLAGVYVVSTSGRAAASPDSFELRMRGPADVRVIRHGPWWTTRHTVVVISILSGGLVLAAAWVTALRRTVAHRSRELAREIKEREVVERHRIMEQERSRVAQDLHDELGSGLTEAGILSALLKNPAISQDVKDGYLGQLREVCLSLVTGLDEIVWAVNPRYDSVGDLADYFSLFAPRFLGLGGIRCRLKIDDEVPDLPLDSRRRHGIFLAVKEALTNIVRHSGAHEAHLAIRIDPREMLITLSDDGKGFDPENLPAGSNGVRGMVERFRQLGGDCRIESGAGRGTVVCFRVSLEDMER